MTTQILIVLVLTFVINLITTLSYSVRIVGVRTGTLQPLQSNVTGARLN
jgi:hypothetical protein